MPNSSLVIKTYRWHHVNVRATLNLEDGLILLVRGYAESRSLGLGEAVSELVRHGLSAERPTRLVGGLRVFDLPPDSPKVTTQSIRGLKSED
jgi:hypothetical protein